MNANKLKQILSLIYSSIASVYVHMGGGRHSYYLGLDQTAAAVRMISIGNIPGIISVAVPKLAVAVLLVRLLNPARYQKAILYFLSLSCVVIYVLCAVFLWVQCTPRAGLWNPVKYKPKCWDLHVVVNYFFFAGGTSFFKTATAFFIADKNDSVLRVCRFLPCYIPHDSPLGPTDQQTEKDRSELRAWTRMHVCALAPFQIHTPVH